MDNAEPKMTAQEFETRIAAPLRQLEQARADLEKHRESLRPLFNTYPLACRAINDAHDEVVKDIMAAFFRARVDIGK